MLSIDFTFVWAGINLLILYFFLKKFLFKRVGTFMENRTTEIENDMEKGRALLAEGEALKQEHKNLLERAAAERTQLLESARKQAAKDYDDVIADAKREASRIIAQAREEAMREQMETAKMLREEVITLAMAAATKIIEENMDNQTNRRLVEELLKKEGVA